MKTYLRSFRLRVATMRTFQRVFYLITLGLITLYIFSLFAWSGRSGWNYLNLGIGAAMVLATFVYAFIFDEIRLDEFALISVFFALSTLLSTLANGRIESLSRTVYLQIAFSIAVFQFCKQRDHVNDVIVAVLVGGTAFCAYYAFHYRDALIHLSFIDFRSRLGNFFDNENNVGRDFAILALIGFYLTVVKKRWYMAIYVLTMLFLLLTTGSISNLLVCIFSMFVFGIIVVKGKKKWVVIGGFVALAGLGILLFQLPQFRYFEQRFYGIIAAFFGYRNGDSSALERHELAMDAFLFFFESPLFGHGYGYVAEHTVGGFAHNNFAELLANFGIIGFIFYELLLVVPIVRLLRHKSKSPAIVLPLLVYLFLFQFFLVTFGLKIDYIILGLAFGVTSEDYAACVFLSLKEGRIHFGARKNPQAKKVGGLRVLHGTPRPLDTDVYRI